MNFNRLSEYLEGMERRLRALALTRGAAITAAAALCCTVAGVLIANYLGFSPAGILWGRLLLFFGLVVALSAGLALPLLRLNRRKAAHEIEQRCPRFEQRLVTFAEKAGESNAFMELLAADTLDRFGLLWLGAGGGEEGADLVVARLREVVVELADAEERLVKSTLRTLLGPLDRFDRAVREHAHVAREEV